MDFNVHQGAQLAKDTSKGGTKKEIEIKADKISDNAHVSNNLLSALSFQQQAAEDATKLGNVLAVTGGMPIWAWVVLGLFLFLCGGTILWWCISKGIGEVFELLWTILCCCCPSKSKEETPEENKELSGSQSTAQD